MGYDFAVESEDGSREINLEQMGRECVSERLAFLFLPLAKGQVRQRLRRRQVTEPGRNHHITMEKSKDEARRYEKT